MHIETRNLVKTYGARRVVNGVSINVEQGTIVGLLGPNGAGKTTTFYMIVGIEKPDSGEVLIDGREISKMPMHERARAGIGYLPQEASIFRKLSVEDNIMAILETTELSPQKREEKMNELIAEFHVEHIRTRKGSELSGGERRRVEIARSLATDPSFILLDEPFAGVDPISVGDIKDIIRQLKDRGIGVLITDHNVRETLAICEHAYIVSEGAVIAEGTPEEVLADETVRQVYLGDDFTV